MPFNYLSEGERQLVLIARALASGCNCLLLDEPASALDFRNQDIILKTLRKLTHEKQLSIVFTTHYPQHAIHIDDKVLMMYSPDHYRFGQARDLKTDHALQELYDLDIRNISLVEDNRNVNTVIPIFS